MDVAQPKTRLNGWAYVVVVIGVALAVDWLSIGVGPLTHHGGRIWFVLVLATVSAIVWATATNRFRILVMLAIAVVVAAFFSWILQVWVLAAATVALTLSVGLARRQRQ